MHFSAFTLQDANAVFQALASDERLPHALIGHCDDRREAMIGIMLDELHVPLENIGRILVVPERGKGFVVPRPYAVIGENRYEDPGWVERNIRIREQRAKGIELSDDDKKALRENTIDWAFHTAVTLKSYNPFLDQEVEMVIDPHINPTRMLTMGEFTSHLKRHTLGNTVVDVSPLLAPNLTLLYRYGHAPVHWNGAAEKTGDQKSRILSSLAEFAGLLREKGLLGAGYIKKWQELNEWSTGPAL